MTFKITADPQRNHTVYNVWRDGKCVAKHVPDEGTAKLFAAAPELLEALEAILSIPADQDGDILLPTRASPSYLETQDAEIFEPFNKARAAIAKAKEG